jgi:hypothetical protein
MNDQEYFDAILGHIRVLKSNGVSSALWPFWISDREDPKQTQARKQKLVFFYDAHGIKASSFVPVSEQPLGRMEEILLNWSDANLDPASPEA